MKRVAIYLRVSTARQDTDNQRRELEAVAERSGWEVVRIYEDVISGAKGRDNRPGLDSMMKAVNAKRFDMVAAWSVDRLAHSLESGSNPHVSSHGHSGVELTRPPLSARTSKQIGNCSARRPAVPQPVLC